MAMFADMCWLSLHLKVLREHCEESNDARWETAVKLLELDPISDCAILELEELHSRGAFACLPSQTMTNGLAGARSSDQCRAVLEPSLEYSHLIQQKPVQAFLKRMFHAVPRVVGSC